MIRLLIPAVAACFTAFAVQPALADLAPRTGTEIAPAEIEAVVARVASELRESYVFPEKGTLAANTLEASLHGGGYSDIRESKQLAKRLTDMVQSLTGDSHVRVMDGSPFGAQMADSPPEGAGLAVDRLAGGIGYLRLDRFAPPDIFRPAANEALKVLADAPAIIIDMRSNRGGHPASVSYLVSFFLDDGKPQLVNELVWRVRNTLTFRIEHFFSADTPVRLGGKPLYVLVGPDTYSAGEELAYDLQALKLATIVGSPTRGGANPGGLNDVGEGFFAVVPTGRARNPVTGRNWDGIGVRPDVFAEADAAREVALAMAKTATGIR